LAQAEAALAPHGLRPEWRTQGEFLDRLEAQPPGINFATLVGHANLRAAAMGYENRAPTAAELDRMRGLLADELDAGAFGYSSGLIYPPGCYSGVEELAALGEVLARYGAFYATHMRSESVALVEAVEEALAVGRRGGCAVQISHHKACGRSNWGKVEITLGMIDRARAEGVDVTADQYPYIATSTSLGTVLPRWAHEGGAAATLARLREPASRPGVLEAVREAGRTGYYADAGGWGQMLIAGVRSEANRWAEGRTVLEIAARQSLEPEEVILWLLDEEELAVSIVHFTISEADVEQVMSHPLTMIGSDGNATPVTGPHVSGKPHPRGFGTFPRVLGQYVRELGLLSWETAIHKMTGMPAARLGLSDRGVLRAGAYADVVIFDPAQVNDCATYTEPHQAPAGIQHVFINGVVAVENGVLTGRLAGRVLRGR
jgi:N-acyl-D-amino-acid deacylase